MTNDLELDVENQGTIEETIDLIELLAKTNRPEYNVLKTCEELAELQEKLLKFHLKVPEHKPTEEQIIEEVGDVFLRLMILIHQYDWEDAVEKRVEQKEAKLVNYYKEGKYKGGI